MYSGTKNLIMDRNEVKKYNILFLSRPEKQTIFFLNQRMKQLFAVLALALIIGVGPIIKKFSYGENFHPEYDSRVPTAFMEIGKLIISYGYVISERKAGKSIWRECMDIWTLSPVSYLLKFCIPAILCTYK